MLMTGKTSYSAVCSVVKMVMFVKLRQLYDRYSFFNKAMLVILGLIFIFKVVENMVLDLLTSYISDAWKDEHSLRTVAVFSNLDEAFHTIVVVLLVVFFDSGTCRFFVVLSATIACAIGLLLSFPTNFTNKRLYYPSLFLLASAHAALPTMLKAFLDDQSRVRFADDDQRKRYTNFWWLLISSAACLFSLFGPLKAYEFGTLVVVLGLAMAVSGVVFGLSYKCYNIVAPTEKPFKDVLLVVIRAIRNRNANFNIQILPSVKWLRWIDKAAATSSVEQVTTVKYLLKMIPLWICFVGVSLVLASGDTLFIIQAKGLTSDLSPIILLNNVAGLTACVVAAFSSYVIGRFGEVNRYSQQKLQLVRIGAGILCCVPCCIVASKMKANWSVYFLSPQYMLLGAIAGLSGDAFKSLYGAQISDSVLRFGPPFEELARGMGGLVSILCILTVPPKWFPENIEDGHRLSTYYTFLAIVGAGNFVAYCFVSYSYKEDNFLVEDVEAANVTALIGSSEETPESGEMELMGWLKERIYL